MFRHISENQCGACPEGQGIKDSSCEDCSVGKFSKSGACIDCEKGSFTNSMYQYEYNQNDLNKRCSASYVSDRTNHQC